MSELCKEVCNAARGGEIKFEGIKTAMKKGSLARGKKVSFSGQVQEKRERHITPLIEHSSRCNQSGNNSVPAYSTVIN